MYKKLAIILAFFSIFTVVVITTLRSAQSFYKKTPPRHIALGVWTQGLFDPTTHTLNPDSLILFEKETNKKMEIAHYYLGWEYLSDPILVTQFDTLRSHGWMPMLNVNPYFFSQCTANNLTLYAAIAKGNCDDFLHLAGKNLHKINKPFYLLFAWEMNNKQNAWSVPTTGSTAQDFIAAWRHIHTIFVEEKATSVVWVFDPNIPDDPTVPYPIIYPGDKYVDWIGLDGYNWGTTQSWSSWVSFAGVFTSSYTKLITIAKHKPMIIAEVNTTDQGGDKSAWYRDMLTKQLPYNFTNIAAIVFFNEDRTTQEHVNWKIDTSPATLKAFTTAIHTPFY